MTNFSSKTSISRKLTINSQRKMTNFVRSSKEWFRRKNRISRNYKRKIWSFLMSLRMLLRKLLSKSTNSKVKTQLFPSINSYFRTQIRARQNQQKTEKDPRFLLDWARNEWEIGFTSSKSETSVYKTRNRLRCSYQKVYRSSGRSLKTRDLVEANGDHLQKNRGKDLDWD